MKPAPPSETFGRLLALDLPPDFLSDVYGCTPCSLGNSVMPPTLFGWDALNRLLRNNRLYPPRLQLSHSRPEVLAGTPFQRWSGSGEPIGVPRLRIAAIHEALACGATMIINALDDMDDRVRDLAVALGDLLGETVGANGYASTGRDTNFGPHWDDHDVIVLQVAGSKYWRLFTERFGDDAHTLGAPSWEGALVAGDILYIPRGCWHAVTGTGNESLHVTLGISRRRALDLLRAQLDQAAADPWWDSAVPWFGGEKTRAAFERAFAERLAALCATPLSLDRLRNQFGAAAPVPTSPNLPWSVAGSVIDSTILIRWRAGRAQIESMPDGTATARAGGTEVDVGICWRPAIERMMEAPTTIAELAATCGHPPDALTGLVRQLAALGWIELGSV